MHYLIIAVLTFGLSLMGCEGKTGPAGPSGPSGPAGPQGVAGSPGQTGPQGPAGPQGEKGDTGPAGPEGPAGPTGPAGPQGEQGVPGVGADLSNLPENLLADVHHILLQKDGETDPEKGTVILVDGVNPFDAMVDVGVLVGQSTSYVAKAASASKQAIPVTFTWTSKDAEIASVDNGEITGNEKGMTTVTMEVDLRGIEVTFNVTVHDVVKGIIASTGDDLRMAVGDDIMVRAEARDAAQDDVAGPDGNVVPGVTFTWMSSNESVATVDEDGMVVAVGVGTADITAHVADVTSNKIGVTVFAVESIVRNLIPTLPVAGTFVEADVDSVSDGATPPVYSLVTSSAITPSNLSIDVDVEQQDAEGDFAAVGTNDAMVKLVSLDTDVLTFGTVAGTYTGMTTVSTDATGNISVSIAADDSAIGKVVGRGTARVEISSKYAGTKYIEVDITLPAGHKAGS